eukprot:GHVT01090912.1.p2 GENE.GHVT01090912.1~~GHVT01090912.1.p2  ORF type:complete len:124 (+),score=8.89 GHVT01090912.1:127-498(+)
MGRREAAYAGWTRLGSLFLVERSGGRQEFLASNGLASDSAESLNSQSLAGLLDCLVPRFDVAEYALSLKGEIQTSACKEMRHGGACAEWTLPKASVQNAKFKKSKTKCQGQRILGDEAGEVCD